MKPFLLLLLFATPVIASQAPIVVTNVNYVDVINGRILARQYVFSDGALMRHGPMKDLPRLALAGTRIPGDGKYIMSSLFDMHVHLTTGRLSPDVAMRLNVANGVTGLRDMGAYADSLAPIRRRIASDPTLPRVWFAGPIVDGPKQRWSHAFDLHITTVEDARKAVDSLRALNVDFIKVYSTIPAPAYFELARIARASGMVFGGHIPSSVTTTEAVNAGQRTFEHATMDMFAECVPEGPTKVRGILNAWITRGYTGRFEEMAKFRAARDENKCAKMMLNLARAGAYVTPTMVNELKDSSTLSHGSLRYLSADLHTACTETIEQIESARDSIRQSVYRSFQRDVAALKARKIKLLAGTDTPNACLVPGFSLHDELFELVRAGLTPAEALRTATKTPRDFLGVKDGDFIILDANPLADIRSTTRIAAVYIRGRWLDRQQLDR